MENNLILGILALVYFIFLGIPIFITVVNIIKLIENMRSRLIMNEKWQKKFYNIDCWTIWLGITFNVILWEILDFKDFSEPIVINYGTSVHSPIQSSHMLTIIVILLIGYISYIFIREKRTKLSPLVYVINLALILITNILGAVIVIQLSNNLLVFEDSLIKPFYLVYFMMLFPFNFLICSIMLIRQLNHEYATKMFKIEFKNKLLGYMNEIIIKSNNWTLIAFALSLPILIFIVMILTLFGQQPDSIIKAFTETSDWTLSQQISPPPVAFDDHYLCTVSLRGHRKIVKPKRYGIRRGERIVVNRQLMVANAFEEVIQEKMPKTHRVIRYIYDKYGFPLSKVITTQISADIVYILMKPLEYFFLICIYSVDTNPENRIEKQYLPIKY